MTKSMVVLAVLSALAAAPGAQASRARSMITGTGDGGFILGANGSSGSFHADDDYNLFYNPAFVNDQADWAIIEKSNFTGAGLGGTAQGGFITSFADVKFGGYFNRLAAIHPGFTAATASTMRPIEFVLGADSGLRWGVGVSYASARSGAGTSAQLGLNAGVTFTGSLLRDLSPFVNAIVIGEDKAAGTKNTAVTGGFRYRWGEWTPYMAYRHLSTAGVGTDAYGGGLARNTRVAEGLSFGWSLGAWRETGARRLIVPFHLFGEAEATTWLRIRGGLAFAMADQSDGATNPDTTTARLGASFVLGQVDLDFAFGNTFAAAESLGDTDAQNLSLAAGTFSTLSLRYRW